MSRIWLLLLAAVFASSAARADDVDRFRAICASRADAAEKSVRMTVAGRDGWLFLDSELRHLSIPQFWGADAAKVSRAEDPTNPDPLPAIVDFADQLHRAGVELILVPVPAKAVVYPEMLDPGLAQARTPLDPQHDAFYELLRKQNVTVIDLRAAFLKAREKTQLFCRQDSHWSGRGCALAGRVIADQIRQRDWGKAVPASSLVSEWRKTEIEGDLWKELAEPRPPTEVVDLRFISRITPISRTNVADDADSPLVLMGDSHCLIFHDGGDMQAQGAGLADQLAFELGFAVDLVAVRGSGATAARINLMRAGRREGYLARKKAVVWCFSCREFTQSSSWAKVKLR